MDLDRVLSGIQHRARLHGPRETGRAVRAVLEGLAEIIPEKAFKRIVTRLPENARPQLSGRAGADGVLVNSHAFIARLADRLHVDEPDAAFLARVVFEHLNEATHGVTPSTIAYLVPLDLRPLLNAHAPDTATVRSLPSVVDWPAEAAVADVTPFELELDETLSVDTVIATPAERPRRPIPAT